MFSWFHLLYCFCYRNADTDDLWMFLSKASGQDVGSLMNSWIREIGFPVVKVSILKTPEAEESGVTTIQMTQQRDALTLRQKLNKIL